MQVFFKYFVLKTLISIDAFLRLGKTISSDYSVYEEKSAHNTGKYIIALMVLRYVHIALLTFSPCGAMM